MGLSSPQAVDIPFSSTEISRLNVLVKREKIEFVNNGTMQVDEEITTRVNALKGQENIISNIGITREMDPDRLKKKIDKLNEIGSYYESDVEGELESIIFRKVSSDKAQNQVARLIAMRQSAWRQGEVRMDQATIRKNDNGEWEKANTTRPDIQVASDENSEDIGYISYEFDRPPNARVDDHVQNYLAAHPKGELVLFEMESKSMTSQQLEALDSLVQKRTASWLNNQ